MASKQPKRLTIHKDQRVSYPGVRGLRVERRPDEFWVAVTDDGRQVSQGNRVRWRAAYAGARRVAAGFPTRQPEQRERRPATTREDRAAVTERIWAKSPGACWYCDRCIERRRHGRRHGARSWEIEHKTPRSRGGGDELSNLVPACSPCNIAKRTRTAAEYLAVLGDRAAPRHRASRRPHRRSGTAGRRR